MKKNDNRKVQGVPQSQAAVLPRHQEEDETDKTKQAQIEQTYEKHYKISSLYPKPGLQHEFGNLTLFSPVQMTSNGPGHSISYKTTCPLSNDSDQPVQMHRLIRVIALR